MLLFFTVFLNLNTFLLWLLACCCVVTCKAKVCHIQTYNKQAKFMRTHAHAHARTPKGLSLKAIPLTWPDHNMYINVSDKHLQRSEKRGRKSGGPGKSVRLKMRRGNTKRFQQFKRHSSTVREAFSHMVLLLLINFFK